MRSLASPAGSELASANPSPRSKSTILRSPKQRHRHSKPLEAYSAAWKVHSSSGATASLPFFRRATEIDPKFAMAHAALGRIYADLEESDLSEESILRAWQLRDRTSDREKFFYHC
jgi:Tfp pilus assembly protein PilF